MITTNILLGLKKPQLKLNPSPQSHTCTRTCIHTHTCKHIHAYTHRYCYYGCYYYCCYCCYYYCCYYCQFIVGCQKFWTIGSHGKLKMSVDSVYARGQPLPMLKVSRSDPIGVKIIGTQYFCDVYLLIKQVCDNRKYKTIMSAL